VAVLDDVALVAGLRHAGRAGRPARLVLVVGQVRDVADALDHLLPDGRVRVLEVGVLPGPDAERWIDVAPYLRAAPRTPEVPAGPAVPTTTAELPLEPSPPPREASAVGWHVIGPPPPGAPSSPLPRRDPALHRSTSASTQLSNGAAPVALRPPPGLPYAFTGRLPDEADRPGPDGQLARLAASRLGPTVLVWRRARRGTSYEALLHPDGMIELTDGSRVADPSTAAEWASGSAGSVDGWEAWRLESAAGPTLAEACDGALSSSRTPMSIG